MIFLPSPKLTTRTTGPGYKVSECNAPGYTLGYLPKSAQVVEARSPRAYYDLLLTHMSEPKRYGESSKPYSSSFHQLTDSYDQLLTRFMHNPSSVRAFTEHDLKLTGGDAAGIGIEHDVTGDTLDIGRFLDGEPEVFASLTNGTPRAKRVNIVFNMGMVWHVDPSKMLTRQKRIVRLTDWLEAQQIRVKLTIVESSECGHTEIDLKQYHEPVNLNDIAVTTHPDFFRRLQFRVLEYSKTLSGGYGSSAVLNRYVKLHPETLASDDPSETVLYVGSDRMDYVDKEFDALEAKLTAQLESDDLPKTLTVLLA